MEQMTMEEWIQQKTKDDGWKPIPKNVTIYWEPGTLARYPFVTPLTKSKLMVKPDVIVKAKVNDVPAWVGFKAWVSGWGSCFVEYEILQWKERKEA